VVSRISSINGITLLQGGTNPIGSQLVNNAVDHPTVGNGTNR